MIKLPILILILSWLPCGLAVHAENFETGQFVWGDLFTTDPNAAAKFYSDLFGWTVEPDNDSKSERLWLLNDSHPVAGIVGYSKKSKKESQLNARWIGYAVIDSPQAALNLSQNNGGRTVMTSKKVAGLGDIALVADPEDTLVGLISPASDFGGLHRDSLGSWSWVQLFSKNPDSVISFYQQVLSYAINADDRTQRTGDYLLSSASMVRAGLVPLELKQNARGGWLGFIRVAELNLMVEKAETLGGRTLVAPFSAGGGIRMAAVADPLGGLIGLIQYAPIEERPQL